MPPRRKLEMYAVLDDDAEEAVVVVDDRLRKSPKRGMPLDALPEGDGEDSPEELFSEWSEWAGGGPPRRGGWTSWSWSCWIPREGN